MTTRYHALTVVLDHEIREDDAEAIINAIKMVKGVLTVQPHVADVDVYANKQRVRFELEKRILTALRDDR